MEPLFILKGCEKNSSVIIWFEILLQLSGCKNFSGSLRYRLLNFTVEKGYNYFFLSSDENSTP